MHSSKLHYKWHILVVLWLISSSQLWLIQGRRLVKSHSPCRYFIYETCIFSVFVFFFYWMKPTSVSYTDYDWKCGNFFFKNHFLHECHAYKISLGRDLKHSCKLCFDWINFSLEDRVIFFLLFYKTNRKRLDWTHLLSTDLGVHLSLCMCVCASALTHPGNHLVDLITLWKRGLVCPFDLA